MGNARLPGNGLGRSFIIACQHHYVKSHFCHRLHGGLRIRFQYVGGGNSSEVSALFIGKMQGRLSLTGKRRHGRNLDAQLFHQPPVSAVAPDAVHDAGNAPAGKGLKILRCRIGGIPHLVQDGLGKGMLGLAFQGGGNPHQLFRICCAGENVRHLRLAGGEGAGLVQHHGVHPVQVFQRLGVLEQHAHLGATAGADHDGHRRGQSQRAGAGDHQHGNGTVQGKFQIVSRDHPDDERHRRDAHNHRDEHARDLIRQPGNGRFGAARVLHHADDLGQSGILAHLVRTKFQIALGVDRRGGDLVPRALFHRDALAGKGALVNGRPALQHGTVHGNAAAGANDDHVSHRDLLHGNLHDLPVSPHGGSLGA